MMNGVIAYSFVGFGVGTQRAQYSLNKENTLNFLKGIYKGCYKGMKEYSLKL